MKSRKILLLLREGAVVKGDVYRESPLSLFTNFKSRLGGGEKAPERDTRPPPSAPPPPRRIEAGHVTVLEMASFKAKFEMTGWDQDPEGHGERQLEHETASDRGLSW